jgi:hypothetical protein
MPAHLAVRSEREGNVFVSYRADWGNRTSHSFLRDLRFHR